MLRSGGTNSEQILTDLDRLLPMSMSQPRFRQMATTFSMDLDRPGLTPYMRDTSVNGFYQYYLPTNTVGATSKFPLFAAATPPNPFATATVPVDMSTRGTKLGTFTAGGSGATEYDPNTWQAGTNGQGTTEQKTGGFLDASVRRIDLNRISMANYINTQGNLVNTNYVYPTPDATSGQINMTDLPTVQNFFIAQKARCDLARDIFNALRQLTGAKDPRDLTANTTSPEYMALRWSAQLSVNIVDYIDDDDISTPFVWNPVNPTFTTTNTPGTVASVTNPFPGINDVNQDPQNFTSAAQVGLRVVFGFEAPKAVINEAYVQYENASNEVVTGTTATKPFHLNAWVELHNPMLSGSATLQTAPLKDSKGNILTNPYVSYRLLMTDTNSGLDESTANGRQNVLGNPDATNLTVLPTHQNYNVAFGDTNLAWPPAPPKVVPPAKTPPSPTDWAPANALATLAPAAGAFKGTSTSTATSLTATGFYVLGPQVGHTKNENPNLNAFITNRSPHMTHPVPLVNTNAKSIVKPDVAPASVSFLLQRLACPSIPPSATNPYVLVDYMEQVPVFDVREMKLSGKVAAPPPPSSEASVGRVQPFDAVSASTTIPNNSKAVVTGSPGKMFQKYYTNANQPKHSFLAHNYDVPGKIPPKVTVAYGQPNQTTSDTLQMPFSWPNHLDRQVISPMELMTVCAYKPHQFTHNFIAAGAAVGSAPNAQQHLANWTSNSTLLYRLFQVVEAGPRANGAVLNGRIPGKVNINTVWDKEVFRALCDAQRANTFFGPSANLSDQFVDAVWAQIIQQRSPNAAPPIPTITLNDTPFWSIATGPFTGTTDALMQVRGLNAGQGAMNVLTPNATNTNMLLLEPFSTGATPTPLTSHPYQRVEMLNKIFNNLTTRSNTFAVFLTVGFFEVLDDTVRPVRLGAEIGASENRQIRHHMVAIVDRTQLQILNFQLPGVALIPDPAHPTLDHIEVQPIALDPLDTNAPRQYSYIPQSMMQLPLPPGATPVTKPIKDPRTGRNWTLQAGSVLVLDPGTTSEETVVLETEPSSVAFSGDPARLRFRILKQHGVVGPNGTRLTSMNVIVRGNPGPMPKYNARLDPTVVPFVAVID